MLGRAADNLFWMARHMERAENIVRLLQTTRHSNMIKNNDDGEVCRLSLASLQVSGQEELFSKEYGAATKGRVTAFMLCDLNNPSSVKSSLRFARENARATRHLLTSDVWSCMNRTWLAVRDLGYSEISKASIDDHLDWMIDRSYMFRGTMEGSMRRGEGLKFANLGFCLERADYTARFLGAHLGQNNNFATTTRNLQVSDYYQATVLLHALNAYKAYRETFSSSIEVDRIAELLILHEEVPRSLLACVNDVVDILKELNPSSVVLKDVYELQYRLQSVQISQLQRVGIDHFLRDFSKQIDEISLAIQNEFMMVQ
ncbi:conserved hypothetical protein [Candidatus Terasakiella magnetica]|uniref:DUF403 domain-containing protein n=1 Tax=Candidatus Terasakiella magnetica TaxID=1867952 RepID=A0A1C3RKZ6_9PROT|nr:alpha-E domain-containing protein [Candidatus Terasakiella magnetica]SCA57954.1 conserved hypothetical protein [Candidatus Terasakiella magnetica]